MPDTSSSRDEARLEWSVHAPSPDRLILTLKGSLRTDTTARIWKAADRILTSDMPEHLIIDAAHIHYLDTSGQAFLLYFTRQVRARGKSVQITGLKQDFKTTMDQLACFDCREKTAPACRSLFEEAGRAAVRLSRDAGRFLLFVGQFTAAFSYAVTHPGTIRWKDVFSHVENVGARAVFIVSLIGFLMGLIISFQSAMPLRMFGAEIFVAKLLGLSMVRELGPLVTAIILAGRTGSSFAAEIGTMKINEEVNALTTMGLSPARFLVVPRMLAALVVMPFLTMFFILFSLVGGAVVMLSLGFPLITYIQQITSSLTMADFAGGMLKALVFSLLVAWIGCVRGLQTSTGARAVGLSTTSAVVSGIVLIAVSDGIFAVIFYFLEI